MKNAPNCIPGGTETRNPKGSRVEGGLTGVFRNQRKIGFSLIHCKVACLAQRSILLPRFHPNLKGLRPGGLRPKKSNARIINIDAEF